MVRQLEYPEGSLLNRPIDTKCVLEELLLLEVAAYCLNPIVVLSVLVEGLFLFCPLDLLSCLLLLNRF